MLWPFIFVGHGFCPVFYVDEDVAYLFIGIWNARINHSFSYHINTYPHPVCPLVKVYGNNIFV